MNDPKLVLTRLEAILEETLRADLTLADKSGLFAVARLLVADFEQLIVEKMRSEAYAREKAHGFMWHLGAVLGFDITNGHDTRQHYSWALSELSTLMSLVEDVEVCG